MESFFIEGEGARLYTTLGVPDDDARLSEFMILCHPFLEEKKFTHRFLFDVARASVSDQRGAAFMDFSGCGDSGGDLIEFGLDDWLDDIQRVKAHLTERFNRRPLTFHLVGVRFGAALAHLHAAKSADVEKLALVAPVLNGDAYMEELMKQKLVRAMMTSGDGEGSVDSFMRELESGRVIDLDGVAVDRRFRRALSKVNCRAADLPPEIEILLVQQSPRKTLSKEFQAYFDDAVRSGRSIAKACSRTPPFWKAAGVSDHQVVAKLAGEWSNGND